MVNLIDFLWSTYFLGGLLDTFSMVNLIVFLRPIYFFMWSSIHFICGQLDTFSMVSDVQNASLPHRWPHVAFEQLKKQDELWLETLHRNPGKMRCFHSQKIQGGDRPHKPQRHAKTFCKTFLYYGSN